MKLDVALRLSRISNLPTVWTNVLVGVALAAVAVDPLQLVLLLLSMSLYYIGGMFLNDAFDREFDARARSERPIPAGEVSAREVFIHGYAMLAGGLALLVVIGHLGDRAAPWSGAFGGALLAAFILLYNAYHKTNPLSPLLMGICRMLVYLTAALAVAGATPMAVGLAALVLLGYLIGLTYAAKQEHLNRLERAWPLGLLALPPLYGLVLARQEPLAFLPLALLCVWTVLAVRRLLRREPGDVPRAVVALIAGISLLDATLLAGQGETGLMLLAIAGFGLTLGLQRWVSGT